MTEPLCGATGWNDGPLQCDMRAGHPEVEGHFDSHAGVEWR